MIIFVFIAPVLGERGVTKEELRTLSQITTLAPSESTTPEPQNSAISPVEPTHPLSEVLQTFLVSLRNLGQTSNIVLPHLSKWKADETKKYEKKLSQYFPKSDGKEEFGDITLETARDFVEFTSTLKKLDELHQNRALPVLARSLFMQLFCEFDAFTGALLKTIYGRNSDLLKGISREISLCDLLEFDNITAVKHAMLDKEVETFRRDSYIEQFAQLEKKFNLTLRKFAEWGEFVEFGQRRNLFTHNDGKINEQYLTVCDRESVIFPVKPKPGDVLSVDGAYFYRAIQVMSKIGYMLCHTLWNKVFPRESKDLHKSLNGHLYDCLENNRWKTAAELGQFALSDLMQKNVSEIDYRIRVINVVIALKFSGSEAEAKKLLNSLDWSASYRDFKLAICVLEDNFDDAVNIMKSIGKTGEIITQHCYHSWPLFHKFRERPDFYETYEAIYGEPYLEKVPADGVSVNVTLSPSRTAKKKKANRTVKTKIAEESDSTTLVKATKSSQQARTGNPSAKSVGR